MSERLEGLFMETIVKRLKEIDEAAAAILEHAAVQKQALSQEMEKKTAEFDASLHMETQETLRQLEEHMETSTANSLQSLEADTEAQIAALQSDYNQNHSQMAGEIFQRIIGNP